MEILVLKQEFAKEDIKLELHNSAKFEPWLLASQAGLRERLNDRNVESLIDVKGRSLNEFTLLKDGERYRLGAEKATQQGVLCDSCNGTFTRETFAAHFRRCTDPEAFRVKGLLTSLKPESWDVWATLESPIFKEGTNERVEPVKVAIQLDGGCQAPLIITPAVAHSLGIDQSHCEKTSLKVVGDGRSSMMECLQCTKVAITVVVASHNNTPRKFPAFPYVYGDGNLLGLPGMNALKIGAPEDGRGIPVFRIEIPRA